MVVQLVRAMSKLKQRLEYWRLYTEVAMWRVG